MARQFIEYVKHPITGREASEPFDMEPLTFPLLKDTSPNGLVDYAYADCYNVLYLFGEGNKTESAKTKIRIRDLLGRITFNDFIYSVGSVLDGERGTTQPLNFNQYYVSQATQLTPAEIQNSVLINPDIIANMPGAVWVDGREHNNTDSQTSVIETYALGDIIGERETDNPYIDEDRISPLVGKPRFELTISNAKFYLTTSSIGSLINNLTWAFEKATKLPHLGCGSVYDNEDYRGFNIANYNLFPSIRTGKPTRSLDALPNIDASTQSLSSTLVRRTEDGFIAPKTCGSRLNITIGVADWANKENPSDPYYKAVITVSDKYDVTSFDPTTGAKLTVEASLISTDSIVHFYLADSTSEGVAFNNHLMSEVTVGTEELTFYSVKKPTAPINLLAVVL